MENKVVLDPIKAMEMAIKSDPNNLKVDAESYSVWIDDLGNRFVEGKDGKFHMLFVKATGFTAKWGERRQDDPAYNPYGPEIADIELTKRCAGIRNSKGVNECCKFCYKNNLATKSEYMTYEQFKVIFEQINKPKTLTQIAFGTDASLSEQSNPDYWKIFDYCIQNGVTPNVTVADVDEDTADRMAKTFGACAVSYYPSIDKNRCYDSVNTILRAVQRNNRKMAVNIHALVSAETYDSLFELLDDYEKDPRLNGLNAIVFLSLKQKGRGVHFNKVTDEQFKRLVGECFARNIRFGMDSCSANKFMRAIKDRPDYDKLVTMIEPCESFGLFSMYVDCLGTYYPCSFMEHEGDWKSGINLLEISDFVKDVWYSDKLCRGRCKSLEDARVNGGCTSCPYYDI